MAKKTQQLQTEVRESVNFLTSSYLRFATFLLTLTTVTLAVTIWLTTINFIFDNNAWETFLSTLRMTISTPLLAIVVLWQVQSLQIVMRKTRQYTKSEIDKLRQNALKASILGSIVAWGVPLFFIPIALYIVLTLPMVSQLSAKE